MKQNMHYKSIRKNGIESFLDRLLTDHTVVAPIRSGDMVTFAVINSGGEATLDYTNSKASPKGVVLPQLETLLSAATGAEGTDVTEHLGNRKPIVLFGLRPCDARGIGFLDRVFNSGKNRDVYYANRREALLTVSLGCSNPQETCFCSTTGGGPFSTEGSDVMLIECGDCYLVNAVTDRGENLVSSLELSDAPDTDVSETTDRCLGIRAAISPEIDLSSLADRLDRSFDESSWRTLTEKCISCGVCTYLCPTCHCFDIVDEETSGVRVRNRIWDSCQFPYFTMQASGFNPRPTFKERYRQRIMHKFSYCFDSYGMTGCVGCGRCVLECPVNLDIRQVVLSFFGAREGCDE